MPQTLATESMIDTTAMPLDFPQFREQVSQSFVPLRVTSDRPEPFPWRYPGRRY